VRRLVAAALAVAVLAVCGLRAEDTKKAAETRKLLKQTKLTIDIKDQRLADAIDALKEEFKEKSGKTLTVIFDTKGGVSLNFKVSYNAKDKNVEEILAGLFEKTDLGWWVDQTKSYDGSVKIVKDAKARGYEPGKEPKEK
jgi:hypothetical protein